MVKKTVMRTLKELFEFTLNNIDKNKAGLCSLWEFYWEHHKISGEEFFELLFYLNSRPTKRAIRGIKRDNPLFNYSHFYWKPYKWRQRKKWLKKQIKEIN